MSTPLLKALIFERRLPYRFISWYENYIGSKILDKRIKFQLKKILKTKSIFSNPGSDIVVFSLICHRDILPYLYSIKSFLKNFKEKVRIEVIDDSSLTKKDYQLLKKHIKTIKIYHKNDLMKKIDNRIIKKYIENGRATTLKLIAPVYLYNNKKMILLDSDIVFVNDLSELREHIKKSDKPLYSFNQKSFHYLNKNKNRRIVNEDFDGFKKKYKFNFELPEKFNAGFLYYNTRRSNLKLIRNIIEYCFDNNLFCDGDQTPHAILLHDGIALSSDKYCTGGYVKNPNGVMYHFSGDIRNTKIYLDKLKESYRQLKCAE